MKKLLFTLCLCIGSLHLFAAKDTINLADPTYAIDDVEAFYYTSAGQGYYSISIWNYDEEIPELRIEVVASQKEYIQGLHEIDLRFCYLNLGENPKVKFTKVVFWLKFTGKNIDGDALYDILAVGDASDGKVYVYRANMPVYAYDRDNGDAIIALKDTLDPEIVEPDITDHGDPTGIGNINSAANLQKVILDGQVLIQKGDKTYTVTGQKIR